MFARFRRATHRDHSARVPGSDLVLEPDRSRTEARGLQGIPQLLSLPHRSVGYDTGSTEWRTRIPVREAQLISLAEKLRWLIPNSDSCVIRNFATHRF